MSSTQVALDGRDDVHHLGEPLDLHQLGRPDAARRADAPEIVAREVDEHRVLGLFLRVCEEFVLEQPVADVRDARAAGCRRSGASMTRRPSTRTSGSGEEPASSIPSIRRKNMYGAGFDTRSRR